MVCGVPGEVESFLNLIGRGQVDLEDCHPVCPGKARAFGSPVTSRESLQDLSPQEASGACDQSCFLSHAVLPCADSCLTTWRCEFDVLLEMDGGWRGCDAVLAALEITGRFPFFPLPLRQHSPSGHLLQLVRS